MKDKAQLKRERSNFSPFRMMGGVRRLNWLCKAPGCGFAAKVSGDCPECRNELEQVGERREIASRDKRRKGIFFITGRRPRKAKRRMLGKGPSPLKKFFKRYKLCST